MKTIKTITNENKTTQTIVIRERVVVEAEGKSTSGNRKPVVCWKADGSEIRKFASSKDAAEALKVHHNYIHVAIKNRQLCYYQMRSSYRKKSNH